MIFVATTLRMWPLINDGRARHTVAGREWGVVWHSVARNSRFCGLSFRHCAPTDVFCNNDGDFPLRFNVFMTHTRPFTIQKCLCVYVCGGGGGARGRPKGPGVRRINRVHRLVVLLNQLASNSKKPASAVAQLRKLVKKGLNWLCIMCVTKWKTTKICTCPCSFGRIGSSISQKIKEETVCWIPRTSERHVISKEGYRKYRSTSIDELSEKDRSVRGQTCAILLHTFPALA
jgi:hypothetical protein